MISALVLATLLSIQDPNNDAVGNGTLIPPTSQDFTVGSLDITEFSVLDDPSLTIELKFASLANPFERVLGFSFPIIELYVQDNDASAGANTSLEGSSMVFPKGSFWSYAIRLTGDKAELFEWTEKGLEKREPVSVFTKDNTLTIRTPINLPRNLTTYGIVGYYTPFSQTGWQDISPNPSPWAYSSQDQQSPVVDVISENPDAQIQAIQQNVIPPIASSSPPNYWIYVMIAGLCLAIFGFFVRTRSRLSREKPLEPQISESEPSKPEVSEPEVQNPNPKRSPQEVAAFEAFLRMPNSPEPQTPSGASKMPNKPALNLEADDFEADDLEETLPMDLEVDTEAEPFENQAQEQDPPLFSEDETASTPNASDFLDDPTEPKGKSGLVEGSSPLELEIGEFPDGESWESETDDLWRKANEADA